MVDSSCKKGSIGSTGQTAAEVVKLIKDGRCQEALVTMLVPPPPSVAAQAPPNVQALANWKKRAEACRISSSKGRLAFSEILDLNVNDSVVNAGVHVRTITTTWSFALPNLISCQSRSQLSFTNPQSPYLSLVVVADTSSRSLISSGRKPVRDWPGPQFLPTSAYVAKNWVAPLAQYVCADADGGIAVRKRYVLNGIQFGCFPLVCEQENMLS